MLRREVSLYILQRLSNIKLLLFNDTIYIGRKSCKLILGKHYCRTLKKHTCLIEPIGTTSKTDIYCFPFGFVDFIEMEQGVIYVRSNAPRTIMGNCTFKHNFTLYILLVSIYISTPLPTAIISTNNRRNIEGRDAMGKKKISKNVKSAEEVFEFADNMLVSLPLIKIGVGNIV